MCATDGGGWVVWGEWGGNVPSCGVLVSTMMMPLCIWGVRLEMSAEAPQMGQPVTA